jgi:hypothetical protein
VLQLTLNPPSNPIRPKLPISAPTQPVAQRTNRVSTYAKTSRLLHSPRHAVTAFLLTCNVHFCSNWEAPCLSFCLSPEDNNQQLFWIAPAPGGPGPFQDFNWTIGSWGPSPGVTTYWTDQKNDNSQWYEYPGTGAVDDYWKQNVWTWYAFWGH